MHGLYEFIKNKDVKIKEEKSCDKLVDYQCSFICKQIVIIIKKIQNTQWIYAKQNTFHKKENILHILITSPNFTFLILKNTNKEIEFSDSHFVLMTAGIY